MTCLSHIGIGKGLGIAYPTLGQALLIHWDQFALGGKTINVSFEEFKGKDTFFVRKWLLLTYFELKTKNTDTGNDAKTLIPGEPTKQERANSDSLSKCETR